ncbi:hypothetical protein ES332_A11G149000v1 [Gossypium tomentosum]|uniref:Uncharacterized protein n=1 Tax=Gossypium tomentosum TaxID=34277 RepID=A0A5D2N9I9_GOSTO|nr:hypothetical protein ES332_A11G149000v1 [Gossypium tomentosum]
MMTSSTCCDGIRNVLAMASQQMSPAILMQRRQQGVRP